MGVKLPEGFVIDQEPSSTLPEGFVLDEPDGFLEKTAKNIIPDIKQTATGLGSMVKEAAFDMPKRAIESGLEVASGVPYAETPSGQKDTEFVQNAPAMGKEMARPVTNPIDYFQEHPVQQTLNALGVAGMAKGMMGAKKPPIVPPETEIPTSAPIPPNPLSEAKSYAESMLPKAQEFVNKQYAKQAKDPGWSNTMARYLQQESQNMAVKQMGFSPMQARQMGEEATQALGQYALDNKIVHPKVGSIGMKERTNAINAKAGKTIGELRDTADKLRDPMQPVDVLQEIRGKLDQAYEPGMPGAHEYETALKIIGKSEPTHAGVADVVTKLNKLANSNNRLKQPHQPFTDAANIASRLNNDRIRSVLGPEKSSVYDKALKDFGATKKIQEGLRRRASREISGRMGPGSFTRDIVQKFLDTVGYKASAKIANKMSDVVLKNPDMAKSLPEMFKEFANQVELLDDDIPGMAHGGVVPDIDDAISHHLRKEKDPNYQEWLRGC